jgi:putative peptidoglycan lipid II flippase
VLLFGVSGAVTGALYALERFRRPAAAGALYNVALIVTMVLFRGRLGVYAVPLGVTVGACAQLLLLAPGMRDGTVRFVLALRHPVVRRVLVLYAPIAFGLVVTQILIVIDTRLASNAGQAALSVMGYATQLIQFPHGLVAVAISVAILPSLSGAHARRESGAFAQILARGMRAVLALILPASVGLIVLAQPLVGAVFQHGAFTDASRALVVLALAGYVLGLPFAAADWPLNYAFYARQDTLTPALVGIFAAGVYLVVALAFGPTFNLAGLGPGVLFVGLVLADSAKQAAHLVAMVVLTRRRIGPEALAGAGRTVLIAGAAAVVMAVAVLAVDHMLTGVVGDGKIAWAFRAGFGALVGAVVYLPLVARLGLPEVTWLLDTVRERLSPRA